MPKFPKVPENQAEILRFLYDRKYEIDGAPDASEISRVYRLPPRQVSSRLRALTDKGLTAELGISPSGAPTYTITDDGRALGAHLEAEDAAAAVWADDVVRYNAETLRRFREEQQRAFEITAAKHDPSGPKV